MSNGIFVRSYPAAGVEVVPATFGVGANGYFLLYSFPISAITWFAIALNNVNPKPAWLLFGLAVSVAGFFISMKFLRSVRLEIRLDGISYTNVIGRSRFVSYSDISTIVRLIDYRHARSEARPRSSIRSWTAAITPKVETGDAPLKIPLTLFSDSARRRVGALI